jgi:hypothetical protein
MKKFAFTLAAAAALVSAAGTAQAAPWYSNNGHEVASWQSINQREARLEMRINAGLRNGTLTRAEARNLRDRLVALERLERNFRRNGLTMAERRVLDARFDALSRSIRIQTADRDFRGDHGFDDHHDYRRF